MDQKEYDILNANQNSLLRSYRKQSFEIIPFIKFSVEKSTIRAFRRVNGHVKLYKPLSIYQVWAYDFIINNIDVVNATGNFPALRRKAVASLETFWKTRDGGKPSFYHFNKLIDLFFKFLPLCTELSQEAKEWIFNNTNVPIDKFSLRLLRQWRPKLNIPSNASMKDVNEETYKQYQKEIRKICRDIPPIVFDLHAWKEGHRKKKKKEHKPFELKPLDKRTVQ